MKGIDNQDPVGGNKNLHNGIDNQGPIDPANSIVGIGSPGPIKEIQDDANLINQIQSTPVNINKNALKTSFGGCSQCGMSHPPIPPGQTCPNASMESQTSDSIKITDQDFNKFLVDMKNILVSQLDQLEVTNSKEIFTVLILKVMEGLEELKKK